MVAEVSWFRWTEDKSKPIVSFTLSSTGKQHLMRADQLGDRVKLLCGAWIPLERGEQSDNITFSEHYCGNCAYKHWLLQNDVIPIPARRDRNQLEGCM